MQVFIKRKYGEQGDWCHRLMSFPPWCYLHYLCKAQIWLLSSSQSLSKYEDNFPKCSRVRHWNVHLNSLFHFNPELSHTFSFPVPQCIPAGQTQPCLLPQGNLSRGRLCHLFASTTYQAHSLFYDFAHSFCFHFPWNLNDNLLIVLIPFSKAPNPQSAFHEHLPSRKQFSSLVLTTHWSSLYVKTCDSGLCICVHACASCYIRNS